MFHFISDDKQFLTQFFVDPNDLSIINNIENKTITLTSFIKNLKSVININKKKALVCYMYDGPESFCTIYSIETKNFTEVKDYNVSCKPEPYAMNLYYMRETKQFLFFCPNTDNIVRISIFDENLNKVGETHKITA